MSLWLNSIFCIKKLYVLKFNQIILAIWRLHLTTLRPSLGRFMILLLSFLILWYFLTISFAFYDFGIKFYKICDMAYKNLMRFLDAVPLHRSSRINKKLESWLKKFLWWNTIVLIQVFIQYRQKAWLGIIHQILIIRRVLLNFILII